MGKDRAVQKPGKISEVTITRAKNGYVVTQTDKNYNRIDYIAKTKPEAKELAGKLLKI